MGAPHIATWSVGNTDLHLHKGILSYNKTYNKYICQKKNKQYIAVGTVRTFIDVHQVKNFQTIVRLTGSPYTTKTARIRC